MADITTATKRDGECQRVSKSFVQCICEYIFPKLNIAAVIRNGFMFFVVVVVVFLLLFLLKAIANALSFAGSPGFRRLIICCSFNWKIIKWILLSVA